MIQPDLERGRVSFFLRTHTTESQRAAVAQNAQAVESEVVGYQYTEICAGYSAFTPTFKEISGGAKYLQQIIPQPTTSTQYAASGKKGTCKGTIMVQMLSDSAHGAYGAVYYFYSTDPAGGSNFYKWYKLNGQTLVEIGETEVPINNGIGFCVNNITGAATYFNIAGQVDAVAQNVACSGYSLMGNSTPVDMYLADIRPMASETANYATSGKKGTCKGTIMVQLLSDAAHGAYGAVYYFYSTDPAGGSNFYKWYKLNGQTLVEIGENEVAIPAGTGFCVNNITGAASYIQLKKPIAN